jgi:O-antigen ligase
MINPNFFKYILLAISLLSPFFNGLKDPVPIFIFETLIFILFYIYINHFTIKKTVIDIPILLFFIFILFSTFTTLYLDSTINIVLMLLSFCILFYLLISIYDEKLQNLFYNGLIIVASVISIIILIQFFIGKIPKATLPNQNMAAGYIAYTSILLLSLVTFQSNNLKTKIIYLVLFLFFSSAIIITHSRGGLFALFFGIAAILLLKFKKWGGIIFITGLLVIFVFLPNKAIKNISKINSGDTFALKRFEIWKTAINIIKEKPF